MQKEIAGVIAGYAGKYALNYAQKAVTTHLSNRPEKIDRLIQKYGSNKLVELSICRTPISYFYKLLLYLVTYGQVSARQKRYQYDQIFHLFINITLDNGLTFGIEKKAGSITLVKDGIPTSDNTECRQVNMNKKDLTLSTFITKGEKKGGSNFWRYTVHKDNSQKFVYDLLLGSDIKTYNTFVLQNIDKIFSDPKLRKLSTQITDVYALYKHYTDNKEADIEDENEDKKKEKYEREYYPFKAKRLESDLSIYDEMMKVLNFKTIDEKVNYFKQIHDENIKHYGEIMFELIMTYPKIYDQLAGKIADKINKENYGGSKIAFFQGYVPRGSAEDLARSVMQLKTLDDRANYLKEMYFVNDKTYTQALLGFTDINDHDDEGNFYDKNIEKMVDEIIDKANEKIKQESEPKPKSELKPEPKPEPKPISDPMSGLTLEQKIEQKYKLNTKQRRKPNKPKIELIPPKIETKHIVVKNTWMDHLNKFRESHPKLSYKECMKGAKLTYKK